MAKRFLVFCAMVNAGADMVEAAEYIHLSKGSVLQDRKVMFLYIVSGGVRGLFLDAAVEAVRGGNSAGIKQFRRPCDDRLTEWLKVTANVSL
jgi:hypothetical protein